MTFTLEDAKNLLSIFSSLGINAKQSGWHFLAHGMMVRDQIAIESCLFKRTIYSTRNVVVGAVVCNKLAIILSEEPMLACLKAGKAST
jgi:hypothetical protein